ncbi:MAG: L-seryl-tRNA(Sec) selenium transferase [Planctomycetaceae bacterium]|nr:L-seryl-tRNA(Sec) selenium transferase [Planctomycetaceae bacterium]
MSPQPILSQIPAVETLLQEAHHEGWTQDVARPLLVESVRAAVEQTRQRLLESPAEAVDATSLRRTILDAAKQLVQTSHKPYYRKVVNATGIILHTALGRAVLPERAIRQIASELSGYSLLQTDLQTGERSRRDGRVEELLKRLTGAEAATVVNNNAAATSIVLNTVARGREVIVSRGQLVEIGGSFRLPEVMAASGATLVEVGTTNKTHSRDYENAVTPNTAAILRVHPSNYKITGFTSETSLADLVRIGHQHGLTVIDDLGAGPLLDFSRFGFQREPTLRESVAAGADLITASADKLIGASQGGLVLGRSDLLEAVRKNPLARILRVGKLTLAALEATLALFVDESQALAEVPTLRMLRRDLGDISEQAERIAAAVQRQTPDASVDVVDGFSQMGSGSLPTQNLATRLVTLASNTFGPDELAFRMRCHEPPVFARIHKGRVLLDPRTLLDGDEPVVIAAAAAAFADHPR